jgi:hypothetical protein
MDTRYGGVRYLCTSGGHPILRDEERLVRLMVVMTGWKKLSHDAALQKYAVASIVKDIWKKNIQGEIQEKVEANQGMGEANQRETEGPTGMDVDIDE